MGQAIIKQKTQSFPPLLDETQLFALWTLADVRELRKRFVMQVNGFALVEAQFESIISFKKDISKYISLEALFDILDNDHDGRLDGLELLGGLALCCQATFEEKAQFCFELYDFNLNSTLSKKEMLIMMIASICGMNMLTGGGEEAEPDIEVFESLADDAFLRADRDGSGQISYSEFVTWARSNRDLMAALESLNRASLQAKLNIDPEDSADEWDEDYLSDSDVPGPASPGGFTKSGKALRSSSVDFGDVECSGESVKEMDVQWRGKICEPTSFRPSSKSNDGPDTNIELAWAFGYRSNNCRNNLHYAIADGEDKDQPGLVVYPTAAIGVVYDTKRKRQRFYQGHSHEITCLAMHPSEQIVVTGDVCSKIHVWNAISMSCMLIITGMVKQGIELVAVSPMGDRIATVGRDQEHTVAIYDMQSGEIISSSKGLASSSYVCDIAFSRDGAELALVGSRQVKFFTGVNTERRAIDSVLGRIGKIGKKQTFFCVSYLDKDAVVGCSTGELYRFRNHACIQVVQAHSIKEPVLCMQYNSKGSVLVTGGRDGLVKTWDLTLKEVGATLDISEDLDGDGKADSGSLDSAVISVQLVGSRILVGTRGSDVFEAFIPTSPQEPYSLNRIAWGHCGADITGVASHPTRNEFATCGSDKTFRVWSIRSKEQSAIRLLPQPAVTIAYNPIGDIIAIGMLDGTVALMESGHPKLRVYSTWRHSLKSIRDIKFSPSGNFLAVASADSNIYIYRSEDKKTFKRQAVCRGHSGAVKHIDFSANSLYLQSNGTDMSLFFWDMAGNEVKSRFVMRDVPWGTQTCVFGWAVQGVWHVNSDYTEINCLTALPDLGVIATGDDYQRVNLYRYPSLQHGAIHQSYVGHASHVSGVSFSNNRRELISIGGRDRTILLWAHEIEKVDDSDNDFNDGESVSSADSFSSMESGRAPDPGSDDEYFGTEEIQVSATGEPLSEAEVRPWKASVVEPTLSVHREEATDCDFNLNWVHGYRSHDCRNNLYYTAEGAIVYHAACLGIAYSKTIGKQRFLQGAHADDIVGLACHPTGQIFASGDSGKQPAVIVWNSTEMKIIRRITGAHNGAVSLLAFNTRGQYLASIGNDKDNTLVVHDWTNGVEIMRTPLSKRRLMCVCFQYCDSTAAGEHDYIITGGQKHLTFWRFHGQNVKSQHGMWGQQKKSTILSVASSTANMCVTGDKTGTLLVWNNFKVASNARKDCQDRAEVYPHDTDIFAIWAIPGSPLQLSNLTDLSKEGIKAAARYITGDGHGTVAIWVLVQVGDDSSPLQLICVKTLKVANLAPLRPQSLVIRSVCERDGQILIGTSSSEIFEISEDDVSYSTSFLASESPSRLDTVSLSKSKSGAATSVPSTTLPPKSSVKAADAPASGTVSQKPKLSISDAFLNDVRIKSEVLVTGHYQGELAALASHPLEPKFFTAGDDSTLRCWTVAPNHELLSFCVVCPEGGRREKVRAIDVIPTDGSHLALALNNGHLYIVLTWIFLKDKRRGQSPREVIAGLIPEGQELPKVPAVARSTTSKQSLGLNQVADLEEAMKGVMQRIQRPSQHSIQCVKYSFEGSYLAVGSHDGNIYLYSIVDRGPNREYSLARCTPRHSSFVSNIDFGVKLDTTIRIEQESEKDDSTSFLRRVTTETEEFDPDAEEIKTSTHVLLEELDSKTGHVIKSRKEPTVSTNPARKLTQADICMQSTCGDFELKFWLVDGIVSSKTSVAMSESPSVLKDAWWATWTLPVGWPVQGIWPLVDDGSTVNTVARANLWSTVPVVASVDQQGRVKLYSYPSVGVGAPDKCYMGHSKHVTNIRFTHDDNFCITTGGNDRCVFVWGTDIADGVRELEASKVAVIPKEFSFVPTSQEVSLEDEFENILQLARQGHFRDLGLFTSKPHPWKSVIREPSVWRDSADLLEIPQASLELKYVYGYRGWDCTNNIGFAESVSSIVYHIASVGIVLNKDLGTQIHNTTHRGEIVCLNVHVDGHTVVTGDRSSRPQIVIWDANTGVTIKAIRFHSKGISNVAFSATGVLVVSVGMDLDRTVAVHNARTGALVGSAITGSSAEILALAVCGDETFVTAGSNHITFWGLPSPSHPGGPLQSKNGIFKNPTAIKSVQSVAYLGVDAVTGMADGTIIIWKDRTTNKSTQAHVGPVSSMCSILGAPSGAGASSGARVVSGGRDGKVKIWNLQLAALFVIDLNITRPLPSSRPQIQSLAFKDDRLLIGTKASEIYDISVLNPSIDTFRLVEGHFSNPTEGRAAASIRGLTMHPTLNRFVTVGDDRTVRVWDSKHKTQCQPPKGIVSLSVPAVAVAYDPDGALVAVATADGIVRILAANNLEDIIGEVTVTTFQVSALQFSPDGHCIAAGASNGHIYLLDVKTASCRSQCSGHSGSVTALDFSCDGVYLQSNSSANELMFWLTVDGSEVASASETRDVAWFSQTCPFGWPVQGTWPSSESGRFHGACVNSVDRSPNETLLVSCDENQNVCLYNYPVPKESAQGRSYVGHSNNVSCVRFTNDGKHVISIGGADKAIMQWAVNHSV